MTTAQDLPVELARVTRLLAEHPHLTPYEVEAVLRAVSRNAAGLTRVDGRPLSRAGRRSVRISGR